MTPVYDAGTIRGQRGGSPLQVAPFTECETCSLMGNGALLAEPANALKKLLNM
jgi:hypothetical protein